MKNHAGMLLAVVLASAMMSGAFGAVVDSVVADYDKEACEDCVPALQIGEWVKGGPHTLGDGTVYLVEFWSTTCPHCTAAIPHLSGIQDTFGTCGVQVVAVSMQDASTVRNFVEAQGDAMNYAVAVDNDWATFRAYDDLYDIPGVPHAFLVDGEGKLVWHGHPENEGLTQQIEAITECVNEEEPVVEACGCSIRSVKALYSKERLQRLFGDWLVIGLSFMALAALTALGRK